MNGMYKERPAPTTLTYGDSITFKIKYGKTLSAGKWKKSAVGTIVEVYTNNPWLVGVRVEGIDKEFIVDTTNNKEI